MHYIVSEIGIGRSFLEVCFYRCSQQNISAGTNESIIPYDLICRGNEVMNLLLSRYQERDKFKASEVDEIRKSLTALEERLMLR